MALEVVRGMLSFAAPAFIHILIQGDMVEYNQCQAMLKTLYDLGIAG